MKTKLLLSMLALLLIVGAFSQPTTIELTFTAIDEADYVKLDSVKVMNRTQGGESVIYWPDTTLMMDITLGDQLLYIGYANVITGIHPVSKETGSFRLFQNFPNPVRDMSVISMYVPQKGTVETMVTDLQGRVLSTSDWKLDQGNHSFRFTRGNDNFYFFTARWNGTSQSIKILTTGPETGNSCSLGYIGAGNDENFLKASAQTEDLVFRQSGIVDVPLMDKTCTFQFATNIPCPGTPTVEYEGQVYNTIQVFSQCWLKENLNVGTMIPGYQNQTNSGTIQKYCYNNEPDSCTNKGGLYQWNEMMQYTTQEGVQGICPVGWHLPTDEDWKLLEGAVDSQYGIGDTVWNIGDWRGFDVGKNLKSTYGWIGNGNGTDMYDFSLLPAGVRSYDGTFEWSGHSDATWTSSQLGPINARYRNFVYAFTQSGRFNYNKYVGFSVRCIKDDNGTASVWSCGNPIMDIENNVYNTVEMGTQCWMQENLKTTTYSNGNAIPNVTYAGAWENLTSGAYVWYNNDISWKDSYGALYNWYAAVDSNGLCPTGWHVPTNDEWTALTDYIGGPGEPHGNELKSCRQVNSPLGGGCNTSDHPRWSSNSSFWGTDDYSFSGLPGGGRYALGSFGNLGDYGICWSSSEDSSEYAWYRTLGYDAGHVFVISYYKQRGFSVRCLKDD